MNKVILMGRLTRDPEVRYSQAAEPMAIGKFTIAVDRRFTKRNAGADEPTADFFNCTAFGKQGEFVEKYLKQGTKVVVSGRVQNDNYTNKNGDKVYSVQIIVEEIEFAESKNASANNAGYNNGGSNYPGPAPAGDSGFMPIPDGVENDLPFK